MRCMNRVFYCFFPLPHCKSKAGYNMQIWFGSCHSAQWLTFLDDLTMLLILGVGLCLKGYVWKHVFLLHDKIPFPCFNYLRWPGHLEYMYWMNRFVSQGFKWQRPLQHCNLTALGSFVTEHWSRRRVTNQSTLRADRGTSEPWSNLS